MAGEVSLLHCQSRARHSGLPLLSAGLLGLSPSASPCLTVLSPRLQSLPDAVCPPRVLLSPKEPAFCPKTIVTRCMAQKGTAVSVVVDSRSHPVPRKRNHGRTSPDLSPYRRAQIEGPDPASP